MLMKELLKDNGMIIRKMDKEYKLLLMELNMICKWKMIRSMDMENILILMEINIMDNGNKIKKW